MDSDDVGLTQKEIFQIVNHLKIRVEARNGRQRFPKIDYML